MNNYLCCKQYLNPMRQLTISVPDNLYDSVLDLFKHIPKVTIQEEEEFKVPEWQKKIVRERIKKFKKNPKKVFSQKEVDKRIKLG